MLSKDTILRRVPATIEPKQALFIDGIRHSVDIMNLAYERLRETLTHVATSEPNSIDLPSVATHAFLDAWAMVDAIDRFRMLYQQMPGITFGTPTPGIETLKSVTQPFRNLRNVADHLSTRADFVVSHGGAALGTLTWITGFNLAPVAVWSCTLRPGTIRVKPEHSKQPIHTTLDWPADQICLSAGGYEANLSSVRPHIERRVRHFEGELAAAFEKLGVTDGPVASDVLMKQPYELAPGQFPEQK